MEKLTSLYSQIMAAPFQTQLCYWTPFGSPLSAQPLLAPPSHSLERCLVLHALVELGQVLKRSVETVVWQQGLESLHGYPGPDLQVWPQRRRVFDARLLLHRQLHDARGTGSGRSSRGSALRLVGNSLGIPIRRSLCWEGRGGEAASNVSAAVL